MCGTWCRVVQEAVFCFANCRAHLYILKESFHISANDHFSSVTRGVLSCLFVGFIGELKSRIELIRERKIGFLHFPVLKST